MYNTHFDVSHALCAFFVFYPNFTIPSHCSQQGTLLTLPSSQTWQWQCIAERGVQKAFWFLPHMFFVNVVWQTVRILNGAQIGKKRTKLVASPWVWQLQAKLKYLTCPISNRVEECSICCGDFFIFGKGVGLFLNFHMSLVGMNTWLLIVVHPIPSNICVLAAFCLAGWI